MKKTSASSVPSVVEISPYPHRRSCAFTTDLVCPVPMSIAGTPGRRKIHIRDPCRNHYESEGYNRHMPQSARIALGTSCLFLALSAGAFAQTAAPPASVLRDMDAAIQSLTSTVAPSVVQVLVTGYRAVEDA